MNALAATASNDSVSDAALFTEEKMNLLNAEVGKTYVIKSISTTDSDMDTFLFRLGCYSGEEITVLTKKRNVCIVVIKDSRYSIDNLLAEAICI
ncbi:FeoA family protein [Arcanobacterium urinimassiliense]|uniref:FeoA family protein n=1 Tax=Arcanobacterium urinimassiliense TaxID=1871014 RepID=UPI00192A363E|nr:FeoA family protein [Arcanobacterium urinimassiliense]MBS6275712.1 ferrous iron transport protein A [Actinomycetaceae bacterium]